MPRRRMHIKCPVCGRICGAYFDPGEEWRCLCKAIIRIPRRSTVPDPKAMSFGQLVGLYAAALVLTVSFVLHITRVVTPNMQRDQEAYQQALARRFAQEHADGHVVRAERRTRPATREGRRKMREQRARQAEKQRIRTVLEKKHAYCAVCRRPAWRISKQKYAIDPDDEFFRRDAKPVWLCGSCRTSTRRVAMTPGGSLRERPSSAWV